MSKKNLIRFLFTVTFGLFSVSQSAHSVCRCKCSTEGPHEEVLADVAPHDYYWECNTLCIQAYKVSGYCPREGVS